MGFIYWLHWMLPLYIAFEHAIHIEEGLDGGTKNR